MYNLNNLLQHEITPVWSSDDWMNLHIAIRHKVDTEFARP